MGSAPVWRVYLFALPGLGDARACTLAGGGLGLAFVRERGEQIRDVPGALLVLCQFEGSDAGAAWSPAAVA